MSVNKPSFVLYLLLFSFNFCKAQIEVAEATAKNFNALGFGGFINFAIPVSDANYVTLEGGLQYFKNKSSEDLALVPVLAGYRYTLNQTGTGFYVEPIAGYSFGASSIGTYDETGEYFN